MVPIEVVAMTEPLAFVESSLPVRLVIAKEEDVAAPKILAPVQVLLLASKVVDAPVNVVCDCQYAAEVVENARF